MGNRRICLEEPWNSVELGIGGQGHVVQRELQVAVWLLGGFDLEFLNRNLVGEKALLGNEVRILLHRQLVEAFLDLHEGKVALCTSPMLL